jgi:hypothetical protein
LKTNNQLIKILPVAAFIFLAIVLVSNASIKTAGAQSAFQTWNMVVISGSGSHSGTLNVLSTGDFTSSGFTGSTSQGTYDISIEGYMSGSTISFTETASYDGGNGYIYASGDGSLNSDFPSATYASGTMSGTITDPYGERSFSMDWTATKTSGESGSGGQDTLDSSYFMDTMLPFLAIGVVSICVVGVILVVRHTVVSKQAKSGLQMQASMGPYRKDAPPQMRQTHPTGPQYGQPNPPPPMQDTVIPPPITMDNGIPITGTGASVVPPDLGGLPFLNGVWGPDRVNLTWGTPQFDPSKYALLGYDISQQTFGPTSTAAQSISIGRLPAGSNATNIQPFNQTYRWNTGGDIAGYRVDPVFAHITPQGQVTSQFHYGGLGIRIGQPFGTFGVGP